MRNFTLSYIILGAPMKKLVVIALIISLGLVSCNKNKVEKSDLKTLKEKASYALGLDIGKNMRKNLIDIDTDKLLAGIKEGLQTDTSKVLTDADVEKIMGDFQQELVGKQQKKVKADADKNKKEGENFLKENGKKQGVVTLPSGLQYKVVTAGNGKTPKLTDKVVVNYRGAFIDGKEFDSSFKRGTPSEFAVNGIVKGLTEALQLMKTGDRWTLYIPSDLAYGDRGAGGIIPPGATIIFEVELLAIK
jgi:FKBP-type peptidyl-prolyl cis-trans isomerase FklB